MRRHYSTGSGLMRNLLFVFLISIVNGPAFSSDSANESKVDLRILIDISGSMKRTDPEKLRASALRLLVGILPENSKSGVWTFGRFVNMVVPLGTVNSKWRKKARAEADNIHSLGLFTNIEEALKKATFDWKKSDPAVHRTIILLSDGMIDISKNNSANKLSRERIINKILPRLKKANITVHTVALSAEADHQLMKTISLSTDGWYEKVEDAHNLQRVFLRLFEKSSTVDKIPLSDNIFEVDKSIEDMTLLVFRSSKDKATRILNPGGKSFTKTRHPKNVKWHHEKGFDLITINDPEDGVWRIDSKIDPDNRVMVVTNLKLSVKKLENNILLGEDVLLNVRLLQDTKVVTQKKLLQHIDFIYKHIKPSNDSSDDERFDVLRDDGKAPDKNSGDGIYNIKLKKLMKGKHQISIISEGPTFQREVFFVVTVHNNPISAEVIQVNNSYQVGLMNKLRLKGLEIDSFIIKYKTKTLSLDVEKIEKNKWTFNLPAKYGGETLKIEYFAKVKDRDEIFFKHIINIPEYLLKEGETKQLNKQLSKQLSKEDDGIEKKALDETEYDENLPDHEKEIKALSESMEEDVDANEDLQENSELINKKKHKRKKEEDVHWILVVAIALVANALLGLIGVGGYFLWKKKRAKQLPVEEAEVAYE